eukprot:2860783-Alexandrium_andersonii.AAC.1
MSFFLKGGVPRWPCAFGSGLCRRCWCWVMGAIQAYCTSAGFRRKATGPIDTAMLGGPTKKRTELHPGQTSLAVAT